MLGSSIFFASALAAFKIGQKRLENNHLVLFSMAHFAVENQTLSVMSFRQGL
jgi:hypothetical protein